MKRSERGIQSDNCFDNFRVADKIGMGAVVARCPLPHHRRTGPYTAVREVVPYLKNSATHSALTRCRASAVRVRIAVGPNIDGYGRRLAGSNLRERIHGDRPGVRTIGSPHVENMRAQ